MAIIHRDPDCLLPIRDEFTGQVTCFNHTPARDEDLDHLTELWKESFPFYVSDSLILNLKTRLDNNINRFTDLVFGKSDLDFNILTEWRTQNDINIDVENLIKLQFVKDGRFTLLDTFNVFKYGGNQFQRALVNESLVIKSHSQEYINLQINFLNLNDFEFYFDALLQQARNGNLRFIGKNNATFSSINQNTLLLTEKSQTDNVIAQSFDFFNSMDLSDVPIKLLEMAVHDDTSFTDLEEYLKSNENIKTQIDSSVLQKILDKSNYIDGKYEDLIVSLRGTFSELTPEKLKLKTLLFFALRQSFMINNLPHLDLFDQEAIKNIMKRKVSFENKLFQNDLEVRNLNDFPIFQKQYTLFRLLDNIQSKAISNIMDPVSMLLNKLNSIPNLVSNININNFEKYKDEIFQSIKEYDDGLTELDSTPIHELSNSEIMISQFRVANRPKFNYIDGEILLSLNIYLNKLKDWLYLRYLSSGDESISKNLELVKSFLSYDNFQDLISTNFNDIKVKVKDILLESLSKLGKTIINGISIVDNFLNIKKTLRLPLTFNKKALEFQQSYYLFRSDQVGDNLEAEKSKYLAIPVLNNFQINGKVYDFSHAFLKLPNFQGFYKPYNESILDGVKDMCSYVAIYKVDYSNSLTSDGYWENKLRNFKASKHNFGLDDYLNFINDESKSYDIGLSTTEGLEIAGITAAISGLAAANAALTTPGLISKAIASGIAFSATAAANVASGLFFREENKDMISDAYLKSKVLKQRVDGKVILGAEHLLFIPYSNFKTVGFISSEVLKITAGVALSLGISKSISNSVSSISTAIRKRKAYKAYLQHNSKKIVSNVQYDEKGNAKVINKYKKEEKQSERFVHLPNGQKVKLTRDELKQKVAFETFIGSGKTNAIKTGLTFGSLGALLTSIPKLNPITGKDETNVTKNQSVYDDTELKKKIDNLKEKFDF